MEGLESGKRIHAIRENEMFVRESVQRALIAAAIEERYPGIPKSDMREHVVEVWFDGDIDGKDNLAARFRDEYASLRERGERIEAENPEALREFLARLKAPKRVTH